MKRILKRGVAILEVAAMSIALLAGLNLGESKDVKAADGTLTVNEAIAISAETGTTVSYSFTAPADDTYYFTTEGESDTYGSLYFDGKTYESDDEGADFNFAIGQELKEGESCVIEVSGYDKEAFESSLIVYDSMAAKDIIVEIRPVEDVVYADLGEKAIFEVASYTLTGEKVSLNSEEYSFEWSKGIYSGDDYEVVELEETSAAYTINSIAQTDYAMQDDDSFIEYLVTIYLNEEYYTYFSFLLYTKAEYVEMKSQNVYAEEGESLTLKVEAYDYYGNIIDTSGSEYKFVWHKETYGDTEYDEVELDSNSSEYTISQVSSTDFYEQKDGSNVGYYVELYLNDKCICYAYIKIYKKEEAPTTEEITTEAPTTEAPTTKQDTTTVAPATTVSEKVTAPAKAKIKKVNAKKKAAKKVKISLKKIKGADGYLVAVYKTKKNAKKNKKAIVKKIVNKTKVTIKSKKLKNKKALFVKIRAFTLNGKTKVYGKWSTVKKVKIKK